MREMARTLAVAIILATGVVVASLAQSPVDDLGSTIVQRSLGNPTTALGNDLIITYRGQNGTATVGPASALGMVSGPINLSNDIIYSGASSSSNSWFSVTGRTLSGTATAGANGQISPFQLSIGADTVNASASPGYLSGLFVQDAPAAGFLGGRASIQGKVVVVGTPGGPPGSAGLVGVFGLGIVRANQTGVTGAYGNYAGSVFGGNSQVIGQNGATFLEILNGHEFDASCEVGCSTAELHAATFVRTKDAAVRAIYDDGALAIGMQDGASSTWQYGLEFGSYAHPWPIGPDGTLIYAWARQVGGSSPSVALNGVDFSNVTFQAGGCAYKSPGFCVDPAGQINIPTMINAANDAAAAAAGVAIGQLYRNGSIVQIRVT